MENARLAVERQQTTEVVKSPRVAQTTNLHVQKLEVERIPDSATEFYPHLDGQIQCGKPEDYHNSVANGPKEQFAQSVGRVHSL